MKVYCSECKNLVEVHEKNKAVNKCVAAQNREFIDTALGRKEVFKRKPEVINEANSCAFYISKRPAAKKDDKKVAVGLPTILDHEARIKALEAKARVKPKAKTKQ